ETPVELAVEETVAIAEPAANEVVEPIAAAEPTVKETPVELAVEAAANEVVEPVAAAEPTVGEAPVELAVEETVAITEPAANEVVEPVAAAEPTVGEAPVELAVEENVAITEPAANEVVDPVAATEPTVEETPVEPTVQETVVIAEPLAKEVVDPVAASEPTVEVTAIEPNIIEAGVKEAAEATVVEPVAEKEKPIRITEETVMETTAKPVATEEEPTAIAEEATVPGVEEAAKESVVVPATAPVEAIELIGEEPTVGAADEELKVTAEEPVAPVVEEEPIPDSVAVEVVTEQSTKEEVVPELVVGQEHVADSMVDDNAPEPVAESLAQVTDHTVKGEFDEAVTTESAEPANAISVSTSHSTEAPIATLEAGEMLRNVADEAHVVAADVAPADAAPESTPVEVSTTAEITKEPETAIIAEETSAWDAPMASTEEVVGTAEESTLTSEASSSAVVEEPNGSSAQIQITEFAPIEESQSTPTASQESTVEDTVVAVPLAYDAEIEPALVVEEEVDSLAGLQPAIVTEDAHHAATTSQETTSDKTPAATTDEAASVAAYETPVVDIEKPLATQETVIVEQEVSTVALTPVEEATDMPVIEDIASTSAVEVAIEEAIVPQTQLSAPGKAKESEATASVEVPNTIAEVTVVEQKEPVVEEIEIAPIIEEASSTPAPVDEVVEVSVEQPEAHTETPAAIEGITVTALDQEVVPVVAEHANESTIPHDTTDPTTVVSEEAKVETSEESATLAVASELERPKSPWASFQVTTVGRGSPDEEHEEPSVEPVVDIATADTEESISVGQPPKTVSATADAEVIDQAATVSHPEVFIDKSSLDEPADAETPEASVDEPPRSWTPSYSVHSQGSPRPNNAELEAEPQEPSARPWTPSYSVHSQGSPMPTQTTLPEEPVVLGDEGAIVAQEEEAVELEEMMFADNEDAPAPAPGVPSVEEVQPSEIITLEATSMTVDETTDPAFGNVVEVAPEAPVQVAADVHEAPVEEVLVEKSGDVDDATAVAPEPQVPQLVVDISEQVAAPGVLEVESTPGGLVPHVEERPESPSSWVPSYSVSVQGSPAQEHSNPLDDDVATVETKATTTEEVIKPESVPVVPVEVPVGEAIETIPQEAEVHGVTASSFNVAIAQVSTESTESATTSEIPTITSLVVDQLEVVNAGSDSLAKDEQAPPKSPWTPSYSVTTQGSTPASDDAELNALEPLPAKIEVAPVGIKVSQDALDLKSEEVVPSVTVEAIPDPVADVPGEAFPTIQTAVEDSKNFKSSNLRLSTLDENTVVASSLTSSDSASPVTGRSRLESTASSRFFPGGWFSPSKTVDESRASLEVAQGVFTAAKIAAATNPSIDEGPVAEEAISPSVENTEPQSASSEEKRRWCVIM
ncbi:hypothetical protein H0H87_007183, partial [Tephrocybe sp. NHM501043]